MKLESQLERLKVADRSLFGKSPEKDLFHSESSSRNRSSFTNLAPKLLRKSYEKSLAKTNSLFSPPSEASRIPSEAYDASSLSLSQGPAKKTSMKRSETHTSLHKRVSDFATQLE